MYTMSCCNLNCDGILVSKMYPFSGRRETLLRFLVCFLVSIAKDLNVWRLVNPKAPATIMLTSCRSAHFSSIYISGIQSNVKMDELCDPYCSLVTNHDICLQILFWRPTAAHLWKIYAHKTLLTLKPRNGPCPKFQRPMNLLVYFIDDYNDVKMKNCPQHSITVWFT